MPAKIHTDKDADLKVFKGKTLAVLGFGSQGHGPESRSQEQQGSFP